MREPNINQELMYDEYKEYGNDLRYELHVIDENTEETIFQGQYKTDESLMEDLYYAEKAVKNYYKEEELDCE